MAEKKIKAYVVHDGEERTEIVYATNSATARREGASQMDTEWDGVEYCRRAPGYDQYAPGPVPPLVLIEDGWRWECFNCYRMVHSDMEDDEYEDDEDPGAYMPCATGHRVYCSKTCQAEDFAKRQANRRAQADLIELVETKFPGCKITRVHVYGERLEASEVGNGIKCSAAFLYPGAKYPATYHFGEGGKAWVPEIDAPAFDAMYRPNP